jgi:hypothetical protein
MPLQATCILIKNFIILSSEWGIWYCLWFSDLSISRLISVVICNQSSMFLSVRYVPGLELMFYIKLCISSWWHFLSNTDNSKTACYMLQSNYFFIIHWAPPPPPPHRKVMHSIQTLGSGLRHSGLINLVISAHPELTQHPSCDWSPLRTMAALTWNLMWQLVGVTTQRPLQV